VQSDLTYLVPAGSTIQSVADADQAGIRIAVARGDTSDLVLTRALDRAELVRTDSIAAAVALLQSGAANAVALNRPSLIAESVALPGSRVLSDGFAEIYSAMAIPKGHAGWLAYINEFIEDAKASGLVNRMIETLAMQGVRAAPPGGPAYVEDSVVCICASDSCGVTSWIRSVRIVDAANRSSPRTDNSSTTS
jgi:polar amino acid transport system substrate-binding protein